jgi:ABC-type lipoprotein export system ATPase subunit
MELKVDKLTKKYSRGEKEFFAVDNISFSLDKGEFVAVIGPSGCGKSTLFSMIAGLVKPDSGTVEMNGESLLKLSKDEFSHLRNTKIGYILQGQNLMQNFTVLENICLPLYLGKDRNTDRAYELIETLGLKELMNSYPASLSGGEQRRVSIARSLAHNPELIIADEPTSNLDPENAKLITEVFMKECKDGKSVLMSSHNLELVANTDRQLKILNGKLIN